MSRRELVTLTKEQEERLVEAFELIVEAESAPVLAPPRRTSFWRRPIVVPVLAFLTVLAVFLPFRLADNGNGVEPTDSASTGENPTGTTQEPSDPPPSTGFSPADAAAMEVGPAAYPFDFEAWVASTPNAKQAIAEVADDDLTPELVDVVRAAASDALASIDAEPPYTAQIISATDHGAWDALVTTSFTGGQCFVVIDEGTSGPEACRTNDSNAPEPILLGLDDTGHTVLTADPALAVGSWVYAVWWGLPTEATYVLYHTASTAATESDTYATPVLEGTIGISLAVQGVDQQISIEARGSDDQTIIEDSMVIPASAGVDDILETSATTIVYETDPTDFAPLMDQGDTFLGGGYVNGEPWAIVGRSLVVEGKPTLECSGVRPIRDEDVCDVVDGLGWMALPVGDIGGVLMVRTTADVDVIRVALSDGTILEAPLVGADQGYPPVAVSPLETAGISGTIYAITNNGDVLWARPFTVTEIVNPGG